jgi:FAD binding domain
MPSRQLPRRHGDVGGGPDRDTVHAFLGPEGHRVLLARPPATGRALACHQSSAAATGVGIAVAGGPGRPLADGRLRYDLAWAGLLWTAALPRRPLPGRAHLLAGDAPRAQPGRRPGMNTGIQDGWNLGWKLPLVSPSLDQRGHAGLPQRPAPPSRPVPGPLHRPAFSVAISTNRWPTRSAPCE